MLASLLFWTPLAPRTAQAQQVELSPEQQREIREAMNHRDIQVDPDRVERIDLGEGAEYEGPPPPESSSGGPLALPGGDTRTAVTPQAISLPTAEGSIEGMGESFTPHLSSGTGSFGVPIAVAPGRAGVQPSFSLAYATSGGNGPVGFGWSLSAPFISRQVDRGVPQYDDQARWHRGEDRFIYNGGQELVPVDSATMARVDLGGSGGPVSYPQGVSNTWQEYRARVEGGFMRFFRAPDFTRWVVISKDGSRFDFGRISTGPSEMVNDSVNALERDPSAPSRVYRWMLTRMVDAHGSPVWYRYRQFDNHAFLHDVTYVSPSTCARGDAESNAGCTTSLSSYASRVAFDYEARPDVFDTWVSGWRIATPQRLARVVVTAWDDTLGARALVRRYHLSYSNSGFHSMLTSVQLEGRREESHEWGVRVLGAPTAETSLGPAPVGPMLPAMRFSYTPAQIDGRVRDVVGSPPHSVDEARSELFDVNSDGLPDLVVTDPARYRTREGRPAVGVFFNGFRGTGASPAEGAAQFSAAVPMPMPAGMDAVMALSNPNVAPMDIDGDGRSDLLHMPRQRTYGWFSPTRTPEGELQASPASQGWQWSYEQITLPATDSDPRIDLGRDGEHIQVLDINNDHLIDVVRTTGTEIQTWLNLGWLEGGEGRFGSYSWSGDRAVLSTAPVRSCLPVAGSVYDFEDPESRLGDMNGDGLQDLVRIRRGRVIYWPGRGDGSFGVGARGCAPGLTSDRHIEMSSPPAEVNVDLAGVHLTDVDSDGAADVVQVRFDAIDVWLNRAGRSFAQRVIVRGVPANPGFVNRIRMVDIDGSGTVDVVYGTAHGWRYVDLAGGQRPRLLTGVENGLGARTELRYETSAADYLRDLRACAEGRTRDCFTWSQPGERDERILTHRSGGSPVISTVVREITTTDRMDVYGLEPQRATQLLHYHDGYYEGIEQEFRGFGVTDSWAVGDWNNPTTITRTWFHQGRRAQAIASERLEHNPDESLKGREYLTETLDEAGNYLASAHATLAVRHLGTGLDGRPIDYAYVTEANELRYDTTPFTAYSGAPLVLSDVVYQSVSETTGAVSPARSPRTREVPIRGARWAQIRTTYDTVDNLGHVLQQTAHGTVAAESGSAVDDPIVSHTEVTRLGTWTWRTRRTWVDGPAATPRLGESEVVEFTTAGDPRVTRTVVSGIPTLAFGGDPAGEGGAIGYDIADARRDIDASVAYDPWGQPVAQCAGGNLGDATSFTAPPAQCLRFGTVTRDARFAQLAESERAWTSTTTSLEMSGTWHRGLGLLLEAEAPNGEVSRMLYDGFGRPVAAIPPPVEGCAEEEELPTTLIRYELTSDPERAPLSRVRTTTVMRTADTCAAAPPIEGIGYVDGLGRPRAALATGDDEHAWVRSGITTFDRKGSVRRTYQPDFYDGSADDFGAAVALPADIPYAVTRYDAFGRARGVIAEDGATVWTSHHALSTDVCDPLDNDHSSPHYRTCTTARVDGHGRVIDQILRNRDPDHGTDEHYRLWSWYRQDGAVLALARTQRFASETRPLTPPARSSTTVVRTFTYDSIGRRWTSADPDTDSPTGQRWRYLFNRLGDLAAVRDPRGCGQNFFYDMGGRLVGEQYVGCAEAASSRDERPVADLPAGALSLVPTTGVVSVDVRYHYDSYAGLGLWATADLPSTAETLATGMPTGVEDRGQRSVIAYDRRGNAVWSARQMAVISNAPALVVASAPNAPPRRTETPSIGYVAYDEAHTYQRTATFDHAARPISMQLPRDPDWDPSGDDEAPAVGGSLTYNRRGLPATATAHIGSHTQPIIAGIRYDRDGAVLRTTWGDGRTGREATQSETRYDRRRRPLRFRTTREPTAAAAGTLAAVNTVVDQELVWDAASNLTDIVDHRDGAEWPEGFRPRTTHVDHDSLYRVVGAFFEYTQSDNRRLPTDRATDYRDTFAALRGEPVESGEGDTPPTEPPRNVDPMLTRPAPMLPEAPPSRAVDIAWSYDFLGNSTEWTDDQDSFYERSIGRITNGLDIGLRPSALYFATNIDRPISTREGNAGWLELDYGAGGNVVAMTVRAQCGPSGPTACTPGVGDDDEARRQSLRDTCACASEQHYEYRWDELNRLAEARRWDRSETRPSWTLAVRQRYRYDGANQRTVKQTLEPVGEGEEPPGVAQERIALYVLPGDFERRGLARSAEMTYEPGPFGTETQYLVAGARLVWKHDGLDPSAHENRRMTVALTDVIQTTAATLDLISGDLVEASTYYPNGARETFLADEGDPSAAEPMGFTGKEADEEVGLVYFGYRYLISRVGRWATPDPLHVHAAGGGDALNAFHYVAATVLQGRDPLGLDVVDTGMGHYHDTRTIAIANTDLPDALDGTAADQAGLRPGDYFLLDPNSDAFTEFNGNLDAMLDYAEDHGLIVLHWTPGYGHTLQELADSRSTLAEITRELAAASLNDTTTAGGDPNGVVGGLCDTCDVDEDLVAAAQVAAALYFAVAAVEQFLDVAGVAVSELIGGVGRQLDLGSLGRPNAIYEAAEGGVAAVKTGTHVGSVPRTRRGRGSVAAAKRDPQRLYTRGQVEEGLQRQGGACAGCGDDIPSLSDARGHHIERHADGGSTSDENLAVLCEDCHIDVHRRP